MKKLKILILKHMVPWRKELKDFRQALTEENALALINQQPFLSGMIIFPAIDLRGGRCVRLFQGLADHETVYHDDPAIPAAKWEQLDQL